MIIEQNYQKVQELLNAFKLWPLQSCKSDYKKLWRDNTLCSEMHKVLQKFVQSKLWQDNTCFKTMSETAQTMANSDSLRQLKIIMSVAFIKSVSKSVYQLVSQSVSRSFSQSWEGHEKVLRNHEHIMRKTWESFEKVMTAINFKQSILRNQILAINFQQSISSHQFLAIIFQQSTSSNQFPVINFKQLISIN